MNILKKVSMVLILVLVLGAVASIGVVAKGFKDFVYTSKRLRLKWGF